MILAEFKVRIAVEGRASMALLSLRGVRLSLGGPPLLDGVDLAVERGDRIGLLGRNGEGKSTLLRVLDGELGVEEGEVLRQSGLRVARLAQEVPEGELGTVGEVVARAPGASARQVERTISRMGLDASLPFGPLSAGMKRRVLLAAAIAPEPDVLLLDEPTNHLDIEAIAWLEDFIGRYEGTLVFVTHDRAFLAKLATRIVEVDRGQLYDWSCDYPTFLVRREQVLAAEQRQAALFDKKLAQEEVWIRQGIQARRTRNEGRVRALESLRVQRKARREQAGAPKAYAQEAERSGTLVVRAEGVGFAYGDKTIVKGLTTTVTRGEKVAVVGPNGAGKTTLLRLLLGELEPTEGTIRRGTNLEVAYFDQLRATLDEEKTVAENVSAYDSIVVDGVSRHIYSYLGDFLFSPERAQRPARFLSGGERNRLLLAKLFTKPSNLLVMDEPTNDLDVETLELLESLLAGYGGTVLLVSHDRAFLENVATTVLRLDPGGQVAEFPGGTDDWLRQKPATPKPSAKADAPPAPRREGRKLGFRQQRELDELPARIDALEAAIVAHQAAQADPFHYRRDPAAIAKDAAEGQALAASLAEAYRVWEELEALRG